MSLVFNGHEFAAKKSLELQKRVLDLNTQGIFPHLASIIIGDNPASNLYVGLKKKAGEAIGIQVDIYTLTKATKKEDVIHLINTLNTDPDINGIMVQMPIPEPLSQYKDEFIQAIDDQKDVDGLKPNSKFLHPTSKAVIDILDYALAQDTDHAIITTVCVVGSTGMVGRPLVSELKKQGYEVIECDIKTKDLGQKVKNCDIVISATGVMNLITPEMIKQKAIVIDVGSPNGDFEKDVSEVASFFTPVPGGVGPVTIVSLFENLVNSMVY